MTGTGPLEVTAQPRGQSAEQAVFRNVPRDFFYKYGEREAIGIPKPGTYRPRFEYTQPRAVGKVGYGDKHQWDNTGFNQANRIKNAQFQENSKLCMCILKALDQEQVDLT